MRAVASSTIGERVAFHRRRRGLSQEVVGGLVGRTGDWLGKIENNRAELDRLSVIRRLADVLNVTLGDLLDEPTLTARPVEAEHKAVAALRDSLMDYRQLDRVAAPGYRATGLSTLAVLQRDVAAVFDAYQASRFGVVTSRAPRLLADALVAVGSHAGADGERAHACLALSYQVAASTLTKLGEGDLAWMAADRGLAAAQRSGSVSVVGSLRRSVVHCLLATDRLDAAIRLTADGPGYFRASLSDGDDRLWSLRLPLPRRRHGLFPPRRPRTDPRVPRPGRTRRRLRRA